MQLLQLQIVVWVWVMVKRKAPTTPLYNIPRPENPERQIHPKKMKISLSLGFCGLIYRAKKRGLQMENLVSKLNSKMSPLVEILLVLKL